MSRTCQFAFAGRSGPAEWSFDEIGLAVSPAEGRPLVFPVQEMAGIAGDGYTIDVDACPGAAPAPRRRRRRTAAARAGSPARADALQTGGGRPHPARRPAAHLAGGAGQGAAPRRLRRGQALLRHGGRTGRCRPPRRRRPGCAHGAPRRAHAAEPFRALLFEDVMVIAREGRDLDPVFIALTERITLRRGRLRHPRSRVARHGRSSFPSWASRPRTCSTPSRSAGGVGKRGGRHPGFRRALALVGLSGHPGGRLASRPAAHLQDLNAICPGFEQAFRSTWLAELRPQGRGAVPARLGGAGVVLAGLLAGGRRVGRGASLGCSPGRMASGSWRPSPEKTAPPTTSPAATRCRLWSPACSALLSSPKKRSTDRRRCSPANGPTSPSPPSSWDSSSTLRAASEGA